MRKGKGEKGLALSGCGGGGRVAEVGGIVCVIRVQSVKFSKNL